MAIRKTTHVLKNAQTNNKSLPTNGIQMGEPLVNLFNGVLFFSGVTSGDYVPFVDPLNSTSGGTYFEVGSNLYNLKIRNQITHYNGVNNLSGKFLSGTTNGFVLANISDIGGISDFIYQPSANTLTIYLSNGSSETVYINSFSGITLTGPSYYQQNISSPTNSYEIANVGFVTAYTANFDANNTYVTGGTNNSATNFTNTASIGLKYNRDIIDNTYSLPYTNTYLTGTTLDNNKVYFYRNDGTSFFVDLNSLSPTGVTSLDTYVTGFTYDSSSNKLTISQNQGKQDLPVFIDVLSGLTISNLTASQVVYVGSDGKLKTESDFLYNDSTNTLTVGTTTSGKLIVNNSLSDGPSTFGQGGLTVGSNGTHSSPGIGDLIVHGNFIVFGTGSTVATNELYVEDPQITLNYNPTGDTSVTSISSGIRIQAGNGYSTGDTYFTIAQMNTFVGNSGDVGNISEYAGPDGYTNRAWVTQLNDIVVRNTNFNNGAPDGARVLVAGDILDGGTY